MRHFLGLPELIEKMRSGVVGLSIYENGEKISSGTGFLCKERLISNNHVFFTPGNNRFSSEAEVGIRFGNMGVDLPDAITIPYDDFMNRLDVGSDRESYDYAAFDLDEITYDNYYNFSLEGSGMILEGQSVMLMGYSFSRSNFGIHVGYVSSVYSKNNVCIIQLDATSNNGNSGGPLINLTTKKVVGIVTRKHTGLDEAFDKMCDGLTQNKSILEKISQGTQVSLGGLNIFQALSASQDQMAIAAKNIKRSANVGISYAFSCDKLMKENFYNES